MFAECHIFILHRLFTVHKKIRLAHIKDRKLSVKEELLYIYFMFYLVLENANSW